MDDLFEIVTVILDLLELTPNSRNKKRKVKEPVIPHWWLFSIISFIIVLILAVCLYPVLKIDLTLYIIVAILVGIFLWGILYLIIINVANAIYLKIIKSKK